METRPNVTRLTELQIRVLDIVHHRAMTTRDVAVVTGCSSDEVLQALGGLLVIGRVDYTDGLWHRREG